MVLDKSHDSYVWFLVHLSGDLFSHFSRHEGVCLLDMRCAQGIFPQLPSALKLVGLKSGKAALLRGSGPLPRKPFRLKGSGKGSGSS